MKLIPQMAPMSWVMIFLLSSLSIMFTMTSTHYHKLMCFTSNPQNNNKEMKLTSQKLLM